MSTDPESDEDFVKEALLLLKAFYTFHCAFCGKPLRIGEEEIFVSDDFDLYHYCCYLDMALEN